MTAPRTYSTVEIARRLGVSIQTVQRWVDSGQLKAWKTFGGHRRIEAESAEALMKRSQGVEVSRQQPNAQTLVAELVVRIEQLHGEEIAAGEIELIDRAREFAAGEALRVAGEAEALQNAADALARSADESQNKLLRAAIERLQAWSGLTGPNFSLTTCVDVFAWYDSGAKSPLPPLRAIAAAQEGSVTA